MRLSTLVASVAVAAASLLTVGTASAAGNHTLWLHGRSSGYAGLPTWNFSYWGHGGWANGNVAQTGVDPRAVNYDGTDHISTTNGTIRAALDASCSRSNGDACYVVCHSAGCAQIGYAMANYYTGQWNIINVYTGGSAAGGSELANAGSWLTGWNIDSDLQTGNMRAMYNHDAIGNDISGWVYNYVGGDWSSITNTFFPCASNHWYGCTGWAGNDSVVAFHSSGHFRSTNSSTGFSNGGSTSGGSFWNWTAASFVDANNGNLGHCVNSGFLGSCKEGSPGNMNNNNGGIMGFVSNNVANLAR